MTKKKQPGTLLYQKWAKEKMQLAVEESKTTNLSNTAIAKKHKLPLTTVRDRYN